jgi:acetyl esterase
MGREARARRRGALALAASVIALLLAGCATDPATPTGPTPTPTLVTEQKDIVFRTVQGTDLTLDACTADGVTNAPILVLVHGGSFAGGAPSDLDFLCQAAARHGFAAFSVGYRLLPAVYPAAADDIAGAVRWLAEPEQTRRFGSDPSRIGMLGASAGAILVAQLVSGTPDGPRRPDGIRAAILLSGFYEPLADDDPLSEVARSYAGCDLQDAACSRRVFAREAVSPDDPPLLVVGAEEEFVPRTQAQHLADAAAAAGVAHELVLVPGSAHAEAILATDPSAQDRVWSFLDRFVR